MARGQGYGKKLSTGARVSKKEALSALGAPADSTFEQAKKSFRRQAMKWHPDRNSSPGAEARFKSIRASYELLEALHVDGAWNRPEPVAEPEEQKAGANWSQAADRGEGRPSEPAPKPARWRKGWDPATGPLFDVGHGPGDPAGSAMDFFDSFMDMAQHFLASGASARMAATVLARGFHGYMTEMAFDIGHLPMLKAVFLKRFWGRRIPGVLVALSQARERFLAMGWARAVADIIEPRTEVHGHEGMDFYIFKELARHLPSGRPSDADMEYYRQCVAEWPALFGRMAQTERGLRAALGLRGMERGPLLVERTLEVCPRLVEVWAQLGTPKDWGAKSDWLGSALASGVDPRALAGWARAEALGKLCARLAALHAQPRAGRWDALRELASARMDEQSDWRGAGPWAGARDALLGRAQRRLDAARKELKAGALGAVALGLGLSSLTVGRKAAREVVFGDPDKVAHILTGAKLVGRLGEALNFDRAPVAALCAMRGFFDVREPLDFYARAKGIESVAGVEQLARRDPDGLTAMDWFERAIERRKALGIE